MYILSGCQNGWLGELLISTRWYCTHISIYDYYIAWRGCAGCFIINIDPRILCYYWQILLESVSFGQFRIFLHTLQTTSMLKVTHKTAQISFISPCVYDIMFNGHLRHRSMGTCMVTIMPDNKLSMYAYSWPLPWHLNSSPNPTCLKIVYFKITFHCLKWTLTYQCFLFHVTIYLEVGALMENFLWRWCMKIGYWQGDHSLNWRCYVKAAYFTVSQSPMVSSFNT